MLWGLRNGLFFFFSNCQCYFYHRKASRPLSWASNRVGVGSGLLSGFLAEGLGESIHGLERRQAGRDFCPTSLKPCPIPFWP